MQTSVNGQIVLRISRLGLLFITQIFDGLRAVHAVHSLVVLHLNGLRFSEPKQVCEVDFQFGIKMKN